MNLLSSQALLAIRLCGSTLDQEMPSVRSSMVSKIWSMLQSKGIPTTVVHYNALLRVHLENGHKFSPDQVLEDMRVQGVTPDKETFQCLISRHCQEGNIDGASKVLQMMKAQGIKVNENIFNSLILGHGESGGMARSYGMLKVMKQWGLIPSQETYLTLACAYAKHGEWQNVEKVMAESQAQGLGFKDGDYLELVYILSEGGHKGHGEAGDMARSYGMLKVMKQWGLIPSQETYLTLACAYAKHGEWHNVEKVMAESQAQGLGFKDG